MVEETTELECPIEKRNATLDRFIEGDLRLVQTRPFRPHLNLFEIYVMKVKEKNLTMSVYRQFKKESGLGDDPQLTWKGDLICKLGHHISFKCNSKDGHLHYIWVKNHEIARSIIWPNANYDRRNRLKRQLRYKFVRFLIESTAHDGMKLEKLYFRKPFEYGPYKFWISPNGAEAEALYSAKRAKEYVETWPSESRITMDEINKLAISLAEIEDYNSIRYDEVNALPTIYLLDRKGNQPWIKDTPKGLMPQV